MENNRELLVQSWGRETLVKLKANISATGITYSNPSSLKRVGVKFRRKRGEIDRISFNMPRHGIFVHLGVGRGTPKSKIGQTKRQAKEWFNPVIEKEIDKLADGLAENTAETISNNIYL